MKMRIFEDDLTIFVASKDIRNQSSTLKFSGKIYATSSVGRKIVVRSSEQSKKTRTRRSRVSAPFLPGFGSGSCILRSMGKSTRCVYIDVPDCAYQEGLCLEICYAR